MQLRPAKCAAVAAVVGLASLFALDGRPGRAADERTDGPMLAHMVFFTLKDRTPQNREKLPRHPQRAQVRETTCPRSHRRP